MLANYGILVAVFGGIALTLVFCLYTGISPISSSRRSFEAIRSAVPQDCTGTIVDLGGGWGGLAFPLARAFPRARVIVYEVSPVPYLFMRLRHLLVRPGNVLLRYGDFTGKPLEGCAVVVCYLYSEVLKKMETKFRSELAPGSLIISNAFDIPGWTAERVIDVNDFMCPRVYVYRIPEPPDMGALVNQVVCDSSLGEADREPLEKNEHERTSCAHAVRGGGRL